MWRNWNPCVLLMEMQNSCYGKQYWQFLKKLKIKLLYDPVIPHLGIHVLKRMVSKGLKYMYTILTAALFAVVKKVEATQVSIDRWDKQNMVLYVYKIILALKRKEILTHAATWMNLEDITSMLREIRQSQNNKYRVISPTWDTQSCQFRRDRKCNSGCQELGGWKLEEGVNA